MNRLASHSKPCTNTLAWLGIKPCRIVSHLLEHNFNRLTKYRIE